MKDILKSILFILLLIFILAFFIKLNEEKPHKVIINGKEYIRSKEYIGNNMYQIILLPVDSIKSSN